MGEGQQGGVKASTTQHCRMARMCTCKAESSLTTMRPLVQCSAVYYRTLARHFLQQISRSSCMDSKKGFLLTRPRVEENKNNRQHSGTGGMTKGAAARRAPATDLTTPCTFHPSIDNNALVIPVLVIHR